MMQKRISYFSNSEIFIEKRPKLQLMFFVIHVNPYSTDKSCKMEIRFSFSLYAILSLCYLLSYQSLSASNPISEELQKVEEALSKNKLANTEDSIAFADLYFKKVYYIGKSDYPKSLEHAEELYAFAESTTIPEVQMYYYHLKARIARDTNSLDAMDLYKKAKVFASDVGEDESLMLIYGEMATYLGYQGKFDEAENTLKKPLEYHKDKGNHEYLSTIYTRLGILNAQQGKYEEALSHFLKGIEAEEQVENSDNILNHYANCGRILLLLGRQKEAIEYQLKVIEKADEFGRPDKKAFALTYLIEILMGLEDYDEALKYGQQALSIASEIGNESDYIDVLANVGYIKFKQGHYSEAVDTLRIVYEYTDSISQKYLWVARGTTLGSALYKINQADEAEKILVQTMKVANEEGFEKEAVQAQMELGFIYFEQGKKDKALVLLQAAYQVMKKDSLKSRLMANVSNNLALLNAEKGNYKTAYELFLESENLIDSLDSKENIREMTKMEKDFQFKQEKKEIELQQQIERAEQKAIQTGLIIGLSALALLAFLIFRNNRTKAKANALLEEKNQQISEQKLALERSNNTKDRLFAILGHDLRKPANAFRGIAKKVNYLLKKEDYERVQQLGDSIETNALGLSSLTDNLLKWALTQKDAISINPESLDVNQIVMESQSVLGRLAEAKEIRIISEIPEHTRILADKDSMLTIIRNLLDNAIKYTPVGGIITLSSKESEVGIDLYVKDTGVGIPQDRTQTIFLLQKEKSTHGTEGEKGTGLGLHLVKELMDLNQGYISVVSKVNEGTTFIIQLPKAA